MSTSLIYNNILIFTETFSEWTELKFLGNWHKVLQYNNKLYKYSDIIISFYVRIISYIIVL